MDGWWTNYPWRMIQPNFQEIDTREFDEDRFMEELVSFSCNAVMLNAAGLIASYPTELADQPRSAFLDGFDLKHLVDRCHEAGIRVIARTDFSKIDESVFERHPDWAYRHADGTPLIYNGYVQTCLSGGYQGGYMDEILKELLTAIPFDGIYCNMGTATGYIVDYSMNRHGPCHCENCRRAFREKYGMSIPETLRPGDKASMIYFRFQQELAAAQKQRVTKLLRSIRPELAYCSVDYVRQEANSEYGRELPHWQYQASSNARAIRGMGVNGTSADVDFMGFSYRHVAATLALQELRLYQTLSNFAGLDYYIMGRPENKADASAYDRVKKVFAYAAAHEKHLYNVQSLADVLLVRDAYVIPNPEERGWIRALTELHIPFDETLLGGLGKIELGRYKAIVLPEKPRLSPEAAQRLDRFVQEGGTVLCIGQPPALSCLGLAETAKRNDRLLGAMLHIRREEQAAFPHFSNRPFVMLGKSYWEAEYAEDTQKYGVLLPPEPFGPPELCYPTAEATSFPAATSRPYGQGQVLYVPWYPGTAYYQNGFDNWLLFMEDVLESLCGLISPAVSLSPMVEITRGRGAGFETIHFVNGSGHFGNSFFDPALLTDQTIAIPWTKDTAVCENMDEPGNLVYTLQNGVLTITVPRLGAHACVIITE